MPEFEKVAPPAGEQIQIKRTRISVPANPIVSRVVGEGIGRDISTVVDSLQRV